MFWNLTFVFEFFLRKVNLKNENFKISNFFREKFAKKSSELFLKKVFSMMKKYFSSNFFSNIKSYLSAFQRHQLELQGVSESETAPETIQWPPPWRRFSNHRLHIWTSCDMRVLRVMWPETHDTLAGDRASDELFWKSIIWTPEIYYDIIIKV